MTAARVAVAPKPGRAPRRRRLAVPPQHGAWAFLALPLVLGLALCGVSGPGVLFALVWVAAYPASYYLSRAVAVRRRRGSWSRIALRERDAAVPWAVLAGSGGLVLVVVRPALLLVAVVLAAGWWAGVLLAAAGRERGFGNDLLLVGQAVVALPVLWYVTSGTWAVPASVWWATGVCATYFAGSVIHVKSLIREADDRRWQVADVVFHAAALLWGLLSAWLLVPFGAAFARSLAMRPGLRPAAIGGVEIGVSVLVGAAVLLAV